MPIVLTIAATFSPASVRAFLLVAAVIAATWTFHLTEFAGEDAKKTASAFIVFALIALVVSWIGHGLEAPPKALPTPDVTVAALSATGNTGRSEPASGTRDTKALSTSRAVGAIVTAPNGVVSVNQQGGQTAQTINYNTYVAPSFGNLKQRTLKLGQEIMDDLYLHGWPVSHTTSFPGTSSPILHMPPDGDDPSMHWQWERGRTMHLLFGPLQDVIDIRDEFANKASIKDDALDQYIQGALDERSRQRIRLSQPQPDEKKQVLYFPTPELIADLTERLKALADQIK